MDVHVKGVFPGLVTLPYQVSLGDFLELVQHNKLWIKTALLKYGALLFRGFPIHCAEDFAAVIKALELGKFVNYIGGDSPRDKVTQNVYTSTEAPPSFHIPLHQELSFIKYHPKHIYFYCDIEPQERGETIIGDARKVYSSLSPNVMDKFSSQYLTYISRYYFESKLMTLLNKWQRSHKSWKEVFETNDKREVERKCIENDFEWQWLSRDWLQIKQTRPAVIKHPDTEEWVWFNQVHLYDFNPRLLGLLNYLGSKLVYFKKSLRFHEVQFANNKQIPRKDLYHIMDVLEQNTVAFPWKKGDVLVLDNILSMHGRAPFNGKRRILTAMTS